MGDILAMRKGGKNVRWYLIEDLHRSYMAGVYDEDLPDWLERHASLTDDEREALRWEMASGDRALSQLLDILKNQDADCIADLAADSGPEAA